MVSRDSAEEGLDEDLGDELDFELVQLGSSNSVHDRTQFESKFDFELSPPASAEEAPRQYEVDLYLFTPQTLGINSSTYSTENFYSDVTHLLRIRTPELRRQSPPPGTREGSLFRVPPLKSVDEYFDNHLNTGRRQALLQLVVHDVRLFGCLIYTELKKLQTDIVRLLKRARQTQRLDLVARFGSRLMERVEGIHREVRKYRERYMWRMRSEPLLLDAPAKRALLLVDEYMSYRLESTLVNIHRLLEPHRIVLDSLLDQIEAILTGELNYRVEFIPGAAGPEEGRAERRHYRLGLLKKFVSEILFLETRRVKRDHLYRNLNAAVGAALAAGFAAITNVPSVRTWGGEGDVGLRIFTLLVLGVVAYVFKDRIKDLSKEYFNAKLKSRLPDFDVMMFYRYFDRTGRETQAYLGSSQEYTRYLTKGGIPADIGYLREFGHHQEIEPERMESTLHYHKKVTFEVKQELREHFGDARIRQVHDVLRLDVSRFLAKLDNPRKSFCYYEPEAGIVTVEAPKVYHVNLVFRYTVTQARNGRPAYRKVDYERIRMVINKKGIVRLENVVPRGDLGYEEDSLIRPPIAEVSGNPYEEASLRARGPIRLRVLAGRKQ